MALSAGGVEMVSGLAGLTAPGGHPGTTRGTQGAVLAARNNSNRLGSCKTGRVFVIARHHCVASTGGAALHAVGSARFAGVVGSIEPIASHAFRTDATGSTSLAVLIVTWQAFVGVKVVTILACGAGCR